MPIGQNITDDQVRMVLNSWGRGKFDAELILHGKAFQPDGRTSAATLIPKCFRSRWSQSSYLNWRLGHGHVLERVCGESRTAWHRQLFDERLDHTNQFPIAAAARLGHVSVDKDKDQITSKLPALAYYQLSLPSPKPRAGVDFDDAAGRRRDPRAGMRFLLTENSWECDMFRSDFSAREKMKPPKRWKQVSASDSKTATRSLKTNYLEVKSS